MPNAAVSASASAAPAGGGSGGGNPFQLVTNLYAEKNNQGAFNSQLTASTQSLGGAVNSGNFLRALRLQVRGSGGVAGTLTPDAPLSLIKQISLTNVDGADILYTRSGYACGIASKYFRPYEKDPKVAYDFSTNQATPGFTLLLKPEVRWTLGTLANTDTRSQYRFDGTIDVTTALGTGYTTAPTINITPYMDAWAQPDGEDLQGQANQPIPPGVNLQIKQRHQVFTLNAANSDNIFQSAIAGNAFRGLAFILRDGSGVRQDALSDPINIQLDNRSMGKYNPDQVFKWMEDFYVSWSQSARETGVYVFPRFIQPGELTGQGWLYTSNATKLILESATANGISGTGTCELLTDEVYPVGPVDPVLVDI